jgi:hypothetical protein
MCRLRTVYTLTMNYLSKEHLFVPVINIIMKYCKLTQNPAATELDLKISTLKKPHS